jgi:hypothetical protein
MRQGYLKDTTVLGIYASNFLCSLEFLHFSYLASFFPDVMKCQFRRANSFLTKKIRKEFESKFLVVIDSTTNLLNWLKESPGFGQRWTAT